MIVNMIELSTAHVTEETAKWLDEIALESTAFLTTGPLIVYPKSVYGWFIPIVEEMDVFKIPNDLLAVLVFAKKESADWVMFDQAVKIIPDLPHYDW